MTLRDFGSLTNSFEEFFLETFPKARSVAARIVGWQSAEDIAVEALARAFARWPAVSRMESSQGWAVRVAVNLAIDQVRRKQPTVPEPLWPNEAEDVALRVDLLEAIGRLPKRQAEVVALRYLADMPEAEVSSRLGISGGAVKSHLHRALNQLRRGMTELEK